MIITWDEPKRQANIGKHGFDFAELSLDGRLLAIGEHNGAVIVAVVLAPLGTEALSVISMRRADRKERSLLHD